jgi:hypothetical protein
MTSFQALACGARAFLKASRHLQFGKEQRMKPRFLTESSGTLILIFLVLMLLAGLPIVVRPDLRDLTDSALLRQA